MQCYHLRPVVFDKARCGVVAMLAVSPRFLGAEQTMLLLPLQLWPCPSPAQPIAALSGGQQPITGRVYAAVKARRRLSSFRLHRAVWKGEYGNTHKYQTCFDCLIFRSYIIYVLCLSTIFHIWLSTSSYLLYCNASLIHFQPDQRIVSDFRYKKLRLCLCISSEISSVWIWSFESMDKIQ